MNYHVFYSTAYYIPLYRSFLKRERYGKTILPCSAFADSNVLQSNDSAMHWCAIRGVHLRLDVAETHLQDDVCKTPTYVCIVVS